MAYCIRCHRDFVDPENCDLCKNVYDAIHVNHDSRPELFHPKEKFMMRITYRVTKKAEIHHVKFALTTGAKDTLYEASVESKEEMVVYLPVL